MDEHKSKCVQQPHNHSSHSAAYAIDPLGAIMKVDRTGRGFIFLRDRSWQCDTEGYAPIVSEDQVCEDCLHAQDESDLIVAWSLQV